MIGYRHCDSRFPFLWTNSEQPPARWHGAGEGPVNYFADTPIGAWAEFLRHEGILSADDLAGVRRSLWAVDLPNDGYETPSLAEKVLRGGESSYAPCQDEARRLRRLGAGRIEAPSAALVPAGASGWVADPDVKTSSIPRDGKVWVVFGPGRDLIGWPAVEAAAPPDRVLSLVNHF